MRLTLRASRESIPPIRSKNMTHVQEVKELIADQGKACNEFATKQIGRIDNIEQVLDQLEAKMGRLGNPNAGNTADVQPAEAKTLRAAVTALLAGDQSKANNLFIEAKAMSVDSDPSGGYV